MKTTRPIFQKKEMALSASPYVYLPVEIPVYTVEVSHREQIDGDLLQRAMEKTLTRMPYLRDTFTVENVKKAGETAVYSLAEGDWAGVNVGDQIFITAKRSGANPFISDEKGNKLVDIQKVN